MVTKATGQPLGRRPRALRNDPERYPIAHFAGRLTVPAPRYTGSIRALAKIIMQAHHGIVESAETREAVSDALLAGRDFRIPMRKLRGNNDASNKDQWRNRDSANAMADNFCKKVLNLERGLVDPSDAEDASDDQKDAHRLAARNRSVHLPGRPLRRGRPARHQSRRIGSFLAGDCAAICNLQFFSGSRRRTLFLSRSN
jgi:hypothetical protein